MENIRKINRQLRKMILITGALLVLLHLTEKRDISRNEDHDGYQTREFDDIW